MKKSIILFGIIALIFLSCKKGEETTAEKTTARKMPVRIEPKNVSYTLVNTKEWLKTRDSSTNLEIALAINRTDKAFFAKMDSVIVPTDLTGDIAYYLPFPLQVSYLDKVDKILFFSYPTQTFAAYENGILIYTGPTNMGRKNDQTPTGLFFTNWKAEETTSTFDDEWKLLWNFNIENKKGVGFHQYDLPGYPASHSCLRLQEKDAKYLYEWADQWVLADEENVKFKGTPVVVFGSYNFDAPKPWLQLVQNPKALTISESEIEKVTTPFLSTILKEQEKKKKS
ncbi:L,D-transpeptidase catalytic domain [Flavobacterium fluvii]|uniref:L,D-transpeptidase catalytic domain n=1 Tax=Flavobacterium fluvii TaxID=468056 RepID=A0A1M5F9D5_9FLAO|nr:L,D-transpeptidase [Flavobacterium fluvii]SHF87671.1 L,D-transpeptidase catalytic domain [Flavobacterium fluvii]